MIKLLNSATAEIFTSGEPMKTVTENWLNRYNADNQSSMKDLVNCILKSTGCELEVTEDDINDPDNITNKVNDLQEEFKGVRRWSIFLVRVNLANTL
jgi:cohesin complex subunit SA-1/2